jgi:hypothetical protein
MPKADDVMQQLINLADKVRKCEYPANVEFEFLMKLLRARGLLTDKCSRKEKVIDLFSFFGWNRFLRVARSFALPPLRGEGCN